MIRRAAAASIYIVSRGSADRYRRDLPLSRKIFQPLFIRRPCGRDLSGAARIR